MKTKQEIRAKKAQLKAKNSIRVVGKTPEKVPKGPTGELELFKKIAIDRAVQGFVHVRHIANGNDSGISYGSDGIKTIKPERGDICYKIIPLTELTPTNFSHEKPKGMYPELRLDPDNIEIVSRAYHHWQHTGQIEQGTYIN